eukprot:SAG31_NODE_583_length_13888_cov_18.838277_12_plen_215_part_00
MRQDVISSDGDAPRPLEKLSCGRISRRQCDKIIHHSIPVGTPCLVTIPHVRGSDIENIARCRWMIAVRQYGDLPMFECPYSGATIRSKGYVTFNFTEGQDAWTFLGIASPKKSKARNRASDVMQHYIELDIPETRIREQPTIENVEAPEPDSVPQVTAVDRTGRVYRPNESGVVVPTEEVIPSLANRNRLEVELSDTCRKLKNWQLNWDAPQRL